MLKRTLLAMTALSSLVLISPTLQDTAMAGPNNKPMIRMIRPQIMLRIDTRRLVTKPAKNQARNGVAEAGPQPEPPTRPKSIQVANVAKQDPAPLPRSRPYNEFEEDGIGRDIDVADALPPELGGPPALEELFDTTGGNLNDLKDVASLLENGLDGQNALRDLGGAGGENFPGGIGGDLPFGGDRIGAWKALGGRGEARLGPGGSNDGFGVDLTAGIPRSPASRAPGPGGEASSEWTYHGSGSFSRQNKTSSDSFTTNFSDPTRVTIASMSFSSVDGTLTNSSLLVIDMTTGKWTLSKLNSEGEIVQIDGGQVEPGTIPPTEHDQNGDGVPDEPEDTGGTQAGQPVPEGGGAATGLCAGWNPANGCGRPGLKIWEITGQPDPSGDGTATTRSAGASIGPEAVTNADEFHTGSGGGGVQIDPCIAAGGDCGNGPDDPHGSTAAIEGVETAGS